MQKRWLITPPISKKEIESLSNALKVSAVVAEILLQRDINDFSQAEQFFRPDIRYIFSNCSIYIWSLYNSKNYKCF